MTVGPTAMDLVSGGLVMSSADYGLVVTLGQGPGGNTVMTSTNYRLRAGLVGAMH
jgi:hypothetical protein